MDGAWFDQLTLTFGAAPDRRRLAKGLAGAALGGLLARLGLEEAAAGCAGATTGCTANDGCATCANTVCQAGKCCRPPGKGCTKGSHCCSGRCNRKKKRCKPCPTGTEPCGGQCVDAGTCGGGGGTCQDPLMQCQGKTGCFECCADTDCCPPGDNRCLNRTTPPLWKGCSAQGVCTCDVYDADRRLDCGSPTGPCQQCCTNDDCVAKFSDPNRVCTVTAGTASCTCSTSHPTLCADSSSGTLKYVCTDTSSNMGHCGFCGNKCNTTLYTRCEGGACRA